MFISRLLLTAKNKTYEQKGRQGDLNKRTEDREKKKTIANEPIRFEHLHRSISDHVEFYLICIWHSKERENLSHTTIGFNES